MSIVRKVRQVQRLYGQLEQEIGNFQKASGIHCLSGCGHCCTKPNIEAAVLEFLPLAFDLYLQRRSEQVRLELTDSKHPICHLYQPLTLGTAAYQMGQCGDYVNRGLICRLFGYATTRDKNGQRVLSTCKWIKSTQPDEVASAQALIARGEVPHYLNYYQKLVQIDFKLGQQYLPVNEAILQAIEEVEHYYQYRPFPYRHRRSA